MSIKNRVTATLLAITLLVIICPTTSMAENTAGLGNFSRVKTYVSGQFTDVPTSAWFAANVATAYELGLMKGTSNTFFNASGNVNIAEAITMASRIYSIYTTGTENFVQGSPWYIVYVDYALQNGIIENVYTNFTKAATRAEFAKILSRALPGEALPAINTVNDGIIPDVSLDSSYASAVYMLYRAGTLTGNDTIGTFTPDSNIGRNAAAAIVTRMADTSLRKSITFPIPATAIALNKTTLSLGVGFSETLTVDFTPSDTTNKAITYTSSNAKVATISTSGQITGIAIGTAVITAKSSNGKTAICNVTVSQLGTRTNPLPGNNDVAIDFQRYAYFGGAKKVIITVEEVITGEAANALAESENMFNTTPTSSQEWRFYIFDLKYISGENADDALQASDIIYGPYFYTLPGSSFPTYGMASLGTQYGAYGVFDVKLYPGASSKVVIGLLTNKDAGDALLQIPYNDGDNNIWILCTAAQ